MSGPIIEHSSPAGLDPLLEHISISDDLWGAAIVRRDFIRPMTNEAFLMAIRPVIQRADEVQVFYIDDKKICILWRGKQKSTYLDMRSFISTTLMARGLRVDPSVMVGYINPRENRADLHAFVERTNTQNPAEEMIESLPNDDDDTPDQIHNDETTIIPRMTAEQSDMYREIRNQKPYRSKLQLLVVEDQIFSQKLLCDILRGARLRGKTESPAIDAVIGLREAWKIFVKRAPDITFIDLNLADGSGHTLARAIKELDPSARVAIVTANNFEEELGVARQNNVDDFIAKPYNKKQILDCIDHYVNASRPSNQGGKRGTGISQF